MAYLLGLHLLVAVGCAALARWWGPRVLLLGAAAPAAAFGWLLTRTRGVLSGRSVEESWPWAAALSLEVPLRLDGLALLLGLLVTGVGAVVLVYSAGYFTGREHGVGRAAALLVLFAGAMLALVLADHLLALYAAWELTTLCSFLLIGDDGRDPVARRAALRALFVTTGFGFVMLLGLVLLGESAGTYRLSALLADPPTGAPATVGLVLVLLGALAKSAQVPLHSWLPAAMVAATPVSAYLHAAAMVKAGVYLVARLAPAFAEVGPWRPIVLTVGLVTMVLGGWRALGQTDLKRLLAFGTVAQLGLLLVLLGAGTRTAALAGATMLLAHGLFKATLFLVAGAVEHEAGTRDLRELSGVGRRAPWLALMALLACLSMAGLPPTVGYLGKEAALEAFAGHGPGGWWVLAGLTVGSVLTVAYTLRFLWGAFADRPGVAPRVEHVRLGLLAPAALVAAGGLVGALPSVVDTVASAHADAYRASGAPYHLALWHGVKAPLLLSVLTLLAGTALHLVRGPVAHARAWTGRVPRAGTVEDRVAAGLAGAARLLTTRTQVGSLPIYLLVMLVAVLAGPGMVLLLRVGVPTRVHLWDTPAQAVLTAGVTAAVIGAAAAGKRLVAVLLVSSAGYFVAGLFMVHGAPDVALTQFLVETLTLLVFVLVLRRMPRRTSTPTAPARALRTVLAVLVGAFGAALTLAATAHRAPSRSIDAYFAQAPKAGGPNVVNVILTEFRALDTLGEVTVLAVAATGVASLVLVSSRMGRPAGPQHAGRTDESAQAAQVGRAGRADP